MEDKDEDKTKKVDAELNIEPKKDEKVPEEKTEIQIEVEKLRGEIRVYGLN
jgi:hypothetical protein